METNKEIPTMLLIEKKVIEETKVDLLKLKATPSPNDHVQSSAMFAESRLKLIERLSKEVEVVDVRAIEKEFMNEAQLESDFFEYCKQKGYQLIKIKE